MIISKSTVLIFTLSLMLFSCDRLKRKTHQIADKTKHIVSNQVEKIWPTYDSYQPDTENNKKRFREHLKVNLTNDVKNIFAHGDFLGADYKVLIAFTCNLTTIKNIIIAKQMQLATDDDNGLFFLNEFKWWNKDKIENIQPYKVGKEYEYWQYLWYDSKTHQAYYEEYSL